MFLGPITIVIENLKLRCIVGVLPEERSHKQEILVNLRIVLAKNQPFPSDELKDTLDYTVLVSKITEFVESSSFYLLESLAAGIVQQVLGFSQVIQVEVKVAKPRTFALRFADSVAVELSGSKYMSFSENGN